MTADRLTLDKEAMAAAAAEEAAAAAAAAASASAGDDNAGDGDGDVTAAASDALVGDEAAAGAGRGFAKDIGFSWAEVDSHRDRFRSPRSSSSKKRAGRAASFDSDSD